MVYVASLVEMEEDVRLLIIISSTISLLVICFVLLKIEQIVGYYECRICKYKYVPTYKSVILAPYIGRTRYMKCSKCNKYSWNRKVISKGNEIDIA